MEDLPGDLALEILYKLAVQDPASLLSATCASKHLCHVADESPALWLKAFLSLEPALSLPPLEGRCNKPSTDFEAAMVSLGVCKQLIVARLAKLKRLSFEQDLLTAQEKKSLRDGKEKQIAHPLGSKENRYLYLIRVQGRLSFWKTHTPGPDKLEFYLFNHIESSRCPELRSTIQLSRYLLEAVYAELQFDKVLQACRPFVDPSLGTYHLKPQIVLEVHELPKQNNEVWGQCLLAPAVYEECCECGWSSGVLEFPARRQISTSDCVTSASSMAGVRKRFARVLYNIETFCLVVAILLFLLPACLIYLCRLLEESLSKQFTRKSDRDDQHLSRPDHGTQTPMACLEQTRH